MVAKLLDVGFIKSDFERAELENKIGKNLHNPFTKFVSGHFPTLLMIRTKQKPP